MYNILKYCTFTQTMASIYGSNFVGMYNIFEIFFYLGILYNRANFQIADFESKTGKKRGFFSGKNIFKIQNFLDILKIY